jgi:uncharacterized protein YukE
MPRVDATPEDIRNFARNLAKFKVELFERTFQLRAQFRQLGDTWRDQEEIRYADEFEQAMRSIQRFINVTDEQIPYLLRKADRLDDYLNQR